MTAMQTKVRVKQMKMWVKQMKTRVKQMEMGLDRPKGKAADLTGPPATAGGKLSLASWALMLLYSALVAL